MRRPLLTAAATLALLAGCTLGPDFQAPTATVPDHWQDPAAPDTGTPSRAVEAAITPDWWNLYGDARLTALEAKVAAANLDLALATSRLVQARAGLTVADAAGQPNVGLNAAYQRERVSPTGLYGLLGAPSSALDLFQPGIDAAWELDFWGHTARAVEGMAATVEATADQRRDVLVAVAAETARDYIQLRGVQADLDLTRRNLDIARHLLDLTHTRQGNGVATTLDVASAAAEVATIEARLPALEEQQARLINALSQLAAEAPGALAAELRTGQPIPPVPAVVPVGLPSELATRRPDIRAASARLHAATAGVGVAEADFYPRITLTADLDLQTTRFTELGAWGSRQYSVGPSVSLPLFDGGQRRGTLELRKGEQQAAALTYQQTVLRAWHEIDDALTSLAASQKRRDRLDEAVRQNQAALDAAEMQYRQGAATYLRVLTVQTALLRTQAQRIEATTSISLAMVGLYKALGGGWEGTFPEVVTSTTPAP